MAQFAPTFHGINLANGSYIENATVEVLTANPAGQTTGGRMWMLGGTGVTQKLKYSYVDDLGAVQIGTFATDEDLQAEITRATNAEGNLSFGDGTSSNLTQAINAERTRALGAEGDLSFADGTSGDITTAINTERSARITTDTSLQNQINAILSNVDATAIDSFSEVVAAYEAADGNLDGAISANVTAIGEEEAARIAADSDLQGKIDTIEANAGLTVDGALNFTTFDSETMQIDLSLNSTLLGAIEAINTELKVGGSDALDAEISRATSAESDLQTAIDTEEAARIAADGNLTFDDGSSTNLTTAINAERTRALAAESDIQTELDATQTALGSVYNATTDSYNAFSGTNYINSNSSITEDLTDLDAQAKTNADAIAAETTARTTAVSNVQSELDGTQTGAGLDTDGSYVAVGTFDAGTNPTGAYYIGGASSLANADMLLDAQVKAIDTEITASQTGAGLNANGTYTANATANYIDTATSLKDADTILDSTLKATNDELTATQSAAGLNTDGSYTANASSNYLSSATGLKDADNKLDARIKLVQDELDATQTGAGLGTGGAYTANASMNYIQSATSLVEADEALDAAVKANDDDIATIQSSAGLDADGGYTAPAGANYIADATTLKAADIALDTKVKANFDEITATQSAVGLNADGSIIAWSGTTYLDASSTIADGITALDTALNQAVITSGNDAADILTELNTTQDSLGGMISGTDGSWVGFTGSNYLDSALTTTGALTALDNQVKTNTDGLAAEVTARTNADTAITTAFEDADTSIVTQINGMRYSTTSTAATSHTITHNLASDNIIVNVWVDQGDGSYANDIVPIAIDSSSQFTVYLSEARAIRVSVMKMDDITDPSA